MQQAIYTNAHIARQAIEPGHGSAAQSKAARLNSDQSKGGAAKAVEVAPVSGRFRHLRLLMSVMGNVLGGAILLSGMLMLPELMVTLLVK